MSLWEVISHPASTPRALGKAALSKLVAFRELIDRFAAVATEKDAFETGREIVKESGLYAELYKNLDPESVSKQENLEEFLAAMQAFVEEGKETGDQVMLADYLQEVALITDQDRKDDDTPKVKLMTVHASKGLGVCQRLRRRTGGEHFSLSHGLRHGTRTGGGAAPALRCHHARRAPLHHHQRPKPLPLRIHAV